MAQKWADQCVDVDYKEDYKRRDPILYHDTNPNRKIGRDSPTQIQLAIPQNIQIITYLVKKEIKISQSEANAISPCW